MKNIKLKKLVANLLLIITVFINLNLVVFAEDDFDFSENDLQEDNSAYTEEELQEDVNFFCEGEYADDEHCEIAKEELTIFQEAKANQEAEEATKKANEIAEDLARIKGELNEVLNEEACIPEDILKDRYIYTIIEEPLTTKDSLSDEEIQNLVNSGAKSFSTNCSRNTFLYSLKSGEDTTPQMHSALLKKCSDTAFTYARENANSNEIEIVFSCQNVQVFFSSGGTSLIEEYIKTIYTFAASLVGLIAVAVLILSGMQISLSAGDSTAIDSAKGRIIKSLAGLAILFLSGIILYTINPNFFTDGKKELPNTTQVEEVNPDLPIENLP